MSANLTGVCLMSHDFVLRMTCRGDGWFVNQCSIMSWAAPRERAPCATSKAGLEGPIRACAAELAGEAIPAVRTGPGRFATETDTVAMQGPEVNARVMARAPFKSWTRVQETGKLAAYLCSEEAGFNTGAGILPDGGGMVQ